MVSLRRAALVATLALALAHGSAAAAGRTEERTYVASNVLAPFIVGENECRTPQVPETSACFALDGETIATVTIVDAGGFDIAYGVGWEAADGIATYQMFCGPTTHGEGTAESWSRASRFHVQVFGTCGSPLPMGFGVPTTGTIAVELR